MKCFKKLIENFSFIDLILQGLKFTWINKKEDELIKERIDRALVNLKWLEVYPMT